MIHIFTGVPIKVKYYLAKFHNGKKSVFLLLLFALSFLLYQESKPFFSSFAPNKKSASISLAQITYPKPEKKEIPPISTDISQVSFDQLQSFANNDYNSPIFELNGDNYQITYQGEEISHLQLSPDKKRIGFYVYPSQENSQLSKVDLVLMNIRNKSFKEISEGDLKISNWEWKDNDQFTIYINCGTGCHLAHVHAVKDGRLIAEYLDKENK